MSKQVQASGPRRVPCTSRAIRGFSAAGAGALAFAIVFLFSPVRAEEPSSPITRIEEDWVVQIGDPDAGSTAPQISIVSTPFDTLQKPYTVFELNNVTLPDYYGGGLQLQSWVDNVNKGSVNHDNFSSLAVPGEEIKFTVRMRIRNGKVRIRIANGVSQTWGTFGGTHMFLDLDTDLTNLNSYSPDNSVQFSRVGYAPNRVRLVQLKEVRYYSGYYQLERTDSQARNVLAAE